MTFVHCELNLLHLKISKMGNFRFTSWSNYVHNYLVRHIITRDSKQIFAINNTQHIVYTTSEDNKNCQRQIIIIQRKSRNENIKWQETHHHIESSNHDPYCNNDNMYDGSNSTMVDASFDNGNGEHIAYDQNGISCHIIHPSMHEHYTHISTIKYNFNPIINIDNGMIIRGSIYSRRERLMLNGIDVSNDKLNRPTTTHTPSDVAFHCICLHREKHIGIASVDNIMHRLTNTMSRCTDDVVGIDINDNNNI